MDGNIVERRNPPLVSGTRENTGEIEIIGDDRFVERVEGALDIIRQHPEFYELVNTYIDVIRPSKWTPEFSYMNPMGDNVSFFLENPRAGLHRTRPVAGVGTRDIGMSLMHLAGAKVHEAYHSKLLHGHVYVDNVINSEEWSRGPAHMKVYEVQADFLNEAGASHEDLSFFNMANDFAWENYFGANQHSDFWATNYETNESAPRPQIARPERFREPIYLPYYVPEMTPEQRQLFREQRCWSHLLPHRNGITDRIMSPIRQVP